MEEARCVSVSDLGSQFFGIFSGLKRKNILLRFNFEEIQPKKAPPAAGH